MKSNTHFYTVSVRTYNDSILMRSGTVINYSTVPLTSIIKLRFRVRYGKKLRFLRFRFRNSGLENCLVNESEVPPLNNNLDSAGDSVEAVSVHLPHVAWVQPTVSIKHLQQRILWCNRLHIDGGQERWIHRFT
jgi:hypothetical protein